MKILGKIWESYLKFPPGNSDLLAESVNYFSKNLEHGGKEPGFEGGFLVGTGFHCAIGFEGSAKRFNEFLFGIEASPVGVVLHAPGSIRRNAKFFGN